MLSWVPAHVSMEGKKQEEELVKAAALHFAPARPSPYEDLFIPQMVQGLERLATQMECCGGHYKDVGDYVQGCASLVVRPYMGHSHETALIRPRKGYTHLTHTRNYLMSQEACLVPLCVYLVSLRVRHMMVEYPDLEELRKRYLSRWK